VLELKYTVPETRMQPCVWDELLSPPGAGPEWTRVFGTEVFRDVERARDGREHLGATVVGLARNSPTPLPHPKKIRRRLPKRPRYTLA